MFYHALQVDEPRCIGCSRCMKTCPTEAIRIYGGKASIQEHRCIDCGKCYEVCPAQAIAIKDDDFESIHNYPHSVALLPAVFMGQFPDEISVSRVYATLQELGFAHVMEVESAAMIYADAKNKYALSHADRYPLISSFCPAIVRLIQIKYPSLTENVMPIKVPLDLSAMYAVAELQRRGVPREEIGLFYITPCAAKIAAVKAPVGEERSLIDGVINMNLLYNRVYKHIKDMGKNHQYPPQSRQRLSADAILSTLTNGERRICAAKRSYAIDGIQNVMDFLDKLENEEVEGVQFLELRACDQSCAGALLSCDNRFLCGERMYARARKAAERERNGEMPRDREMDKYKEYLIENSLVDEVEPRSMMVLDTDISKALEKMEKIERMKVHLPQIDCGVCGAPTCEAFATDVVCQRADLHRCVFYRIHLEQTGKMQLAEGAANMMRVWGKDRINGDIEM
ncbi:MAG: Fe-S cluster domain-containing protein [bacterium P3]|nr:MAG: Fe-S cluster domain-containing protein [bacterium P3]KWW42420.1 MAG: Fe-S cluster domain-containing protein [bacterium F083]